MSTYTVAKPPRLWVGRHKTGATKKEVGWIRMKHSILLYNRNSGTKTLQHSTRPSCWMVHKKVPNWASLEKGWCVCRNFPIICTNYWPCFSEALQYRRRQKLSQPEEKWLFVTPWGALVGGWAEFSSRLTGWKPGLCKWKWTGKGGKRTKVCWKIQ